MQDESARRIESTGVAPDAGRVMLRIVSHPAGSRIRILPNRSLSHTGLRIAAGACLGALLPAILLSLLLGAWPMLPFLGLEIVVVVGAFAWLERHFHDYEEIAIDTEQVSHRRVSGLHTEIRTMPRYWARLVIEPAASRYKPDRLWLRSHGKAIELASDAGAPTRAALAQVLTRECGIATTPVGL